MNEAAMLALNAAHEAQTAPLDAAGLEVLLQAAFHVGRRGDGRDAFLIALDQDSGHPGVNYRWFKERHARFVYVDRIIVDPAARGRGLARELYAELFGKAAGAGHDLVGCEVNLAPPNPGSLAFHAALGFEEAGRSSQNAPKQVLYLARAIPPAR